MSNFRHFSWSLVLLLTVPISVLGAGSARNLTATFEKLHEQAAQLESEWESEAAGDDKREDVSDEGEEPELELATFGNGCFWCTEAIFEELHGVYDVVSGYSGGRVPNPTYKQVCTGLTGHAEVIQMKYNPELISYATLLEVFFRTHDPTTKNRQGPDIGTQYRSVVFYHDEHQKAIARLFIKELNKQRSFRKPVVTLVDEFDKFFAAENYHQDYFELNGRAPYCQRMIRPKLSKFRRVFRDQLEVVVAKKKKNEQKNAETGGSK